MDSHIVRKTLGAVLILILICSTVSAQDETTTEIETVPPPFAVSFNPLGFAQFGPIIAAEIGLNENVALNAHTRLMTLGLVSHLIRYHNDGLDELSGNAFGGGLIYFLNEGQNRPYAGLLLEYETSTAKYAIGESWEWHNDEKTTVFMFNAGYRWTFKGGAFFNLGGYFGAASTKGDWDYVDSSYGLNDSDPRSTTGTTPFAMLEFAVGMGF